MQNSVYESFNDRMRDELLDGTLIYGLGHARANITARADDYNIDQPH
jgi:putative transposase